MSNMIDISVIEELKEVGGDEFLSELITMFLDQADSIMEDIKTFHDNKDSDSLSKAAHKLKGSCLNLGAKDMGAICQTIELQTRENNFNDLDKNIESLSSIYEKTSLDLKSLVQL